MLVQILSIVIALAIAIYFILKSKKKEDQYFGNQITLSKKENKILEYYKSIYQPIPSNNKMPSLKRDGYQLEDIAKTATEIVYDESIPEKQEIDSLVKDDLVKLIFEDKDGNAERMWITYLEKENDFHKGVLANDSYDIEDLKDGKLIYFHANNVFQIDKKTISSQNHI